MCVCSITQEGCGENCSQGLPGVPGMAGAKGEKGDEGKTGITQLDSCDRVRLGGTGTYLLKHFQLHYVILHIQNCIIVCLLRFDEFKMAVPHFASYSSLHGLM